MDYDVLHHLKSLLLPALVGQLKMIKLPHLEGDDEFLHWSVDNAVVDTRGIIPEKIQINTETILDVHGSNTTPRKSKARERRKSLLNTVSRVALKIAGFDASVNGAAFSFKRKVWPRLSDSGIAEVKLVNVAIEVTFQVKTKTSTKHPQFRYLESACGITKLKLKLNDTKHDIFYNGALKVLKNAVRQAVEFSVADSVGTLATQLMASFNVVAETGSTDVKKAPGSPSLPKISEKPAAEADEEKPSPKSQQSPKRTHRSVASTS